MKQGQRLTENGHDVALFPMDFLKITQPPLKVGDTHENTMNIDIAGIDGGISNLYAPFTMKVVQNNNTPNHEIIWWSTDLVKCADGSTSLLSMRTLHDDDVSDLKVGTIKIQGEVATQEGNTGQSQGNHSHLCIAKGHTTKLVKHQSGYHDLVGSVDPSTIFFVNDTVIGNTMGMNFKYYKVSYAPMVDIYGKQYSCDDEMRIRSLPTIKSEIVGKLPKNTLVDILQISAKAQDGYDWVKISNGYCAIVEGAIITNKIEPVIEPIATDNGSEEEKQPEPVVIIEPIIEPEIVIPVIVEPEPPQSEPITDLEPVVNYFPLDSVNTQHKRKTLLQALISLIISVLMFLRSKRKG